MVNRRRLDRLRTGSRRHAVVTLTDVSCCAIGIATANITQAVAAGGLALLMRVEVLAPPGGAACGLRHFARRRDFEPDALAIVLVFPTAPGRAPSSRNTPSVPGIPRRRERTGSRPV